MKQLEVQIMGQNYVLGCPENGETRLLEVVERVDTAMCRIRDAGKVKARDRIAVLAALNLAYELLEAPPAPQAVVEQAAAVPETAGDAPHPQLDALLQRLDAALAGEGSLP